MANNSSNVWELTNSEIELVGGGSDAYENGKSDGEKFGEAIEDIGEAIADAWNDFVDWVQS